MRRYLWLLPALAVLVVVGASSQAAPAKACPKGKVLRVTNGAKACISAKAFRQRPTLTTTGTAQLRRALDRPVTLRLRSGKVVPSVLPPQIATAVLRAYPALEADMIAALRAAQGRPATARENAVTVTGVTVGTPTVNADGSASISGSISASLDGPGNVTVDVGISANTNGALGVDFNLSFDGADGARSSRGFAIKSVLSKPRQECPSATGEIRYGALGKANATLLAYYVPGATLVLDQRTDATVDVVTGAKFKAIPPQKSVNAALAKPVPVATGDGCPTPSATPVVSKSPSPTT